MRQAATRPGDSEGLLGREILRNPCTSYGFARFLRISRVTRTGKSLFEEEKEDAASILKFIPRMLEAWPRHPRTERTRKSDVYKTQLKLVREWQRAEHVEWWCAACFTFSLFDEAVSRR
eukprot:757305-Pyramimonas_sp.AAC.1